MTSDEIITVNANEEEKIKNEDLTNLLNNLQCIVFELQERHNIPFESLISFIRRFYRRPGFDERFDKNINNIIKKSPQIIKKGIDLENG